MESLQARTRPVPPEFTEAELGALAESPAVHALNEPFASAPPPSRSQFVTMADGTRLAISLYFPTGFDEVVDKAPTVYIESWYGRAVEATGTAIDLYRASGFVVALADPRGFGASFGWQTAFMTADVRRDQRAMMAWLTSQSWSNGQVAAVGFSISGSHAEALAATGLPSVRAAVVRAGDFDHYVNNIFPGGVPNTRMMGFVSFLTDWMRGEPCVADLSTCSQMGVAPVDGDADFTSLQAAFRDHQSNLRGQVLQSLVNRDDALGTGTVDDLSTVEKVDELRRAAVPARISASWMDGTTAHSALARCAALPDVPMEVAIGATAHSGGVDADPFSRKPFAAARPGAVEQYGADVAFVKKVLSGQPVGRRISYVALGTGTWKTTPVWPPAGVTVDVLQLSRTELVAGRSRI
jgi:putative CocE/NonD family hydrolase